MAEQTAETGRARAWLGKRVARLVAEKIGAVQIRSGSNEYMISGRKLNFKSASEGSSLVNVYNNVLDRVDGVIFAFGNVGDIYTLFEMDTADVIRYSKPSSSSKSASARAVTFEMCRRYGRSLGETRLSILE